MKIKENAWRQKCLSRYVLQNRPTYDFLTRYVYDRKGINGHKK